MTRLIFKILKSNWRFLLLKSIKLILAGLDHFVSFLDLFTPLIKTWIKNSKRSFMYILFQSPPRVKHISISLNYIILRWWAFYDHVCIYGYPLRDASHYKRHAWYHNSLELILPTTKKLSFINMLALSCITVSFI